MAVSDISRAEAGQSGTNIPDEILTFDYGAHVKHRDTCRRPSPDGDFLEP